MEELHYATMANSRAAAVFSKPKQEWERRNPNAGEQKLVVTVWDSTCVSLMKEIAYDQQQRHFSTKTKSNALVKLMGSGLNGTGMYVYCMAASLSPSCTDEGIGRFVLDMEIGQNIVGGFYDALFGMPGYFMVHLFDRGENNFYL